MQRHPNHTARRSASSGHQERRDTAFNDVEGFSYVERLPSPRFTDDWERIYVPPEKKEQGLRFLDLLVQLAPFEASRVGLSVSRTILFCGPPGCGKSSLARSLPNEWTSRTGVEGILIVANCHQMASDQRGGTQKNVQEFFQRIEEVASLGLPTFVVVDEAETLATNRGSVNPQTNPLDTLFAVDALIESLDRLIISRTNVCLLLTTNQHRHIDRAITDRVDLEILIELPGPSERTQILRDALGVVEQLGIFPLALKGPGRQAAGGLGRLVKATDRFSGRDLRHLVVEALTLRAADEPLTWNHLIRAAEIKRAMNQHHTNSKGGYLHDYE